MKQFDYDISLHPSDDFKQVAYFCSEDGTCNLEEVPADQVKILADILGARGLDGWELVHMAFSASGLMAFWKRGMPAD